MLIATGLVLAKVQMDELILRLDMNQDNMCVP